jgi:hypothetical protein
LVQERVLGVSGLWGKQEVVAMTGMGVWGKWRVTGVMVGAQEESVVVDKVERGETVAVGRRGEGESVGEVLAVWLSILLPLSASPSISILA